MSFILNPYIHSRKQPNTVMELSYNSTTSLNLRIDTISGRDWVVDWGDGVEERYAASQSTTITKNFGVSTTGVVKIRSVNNWRSDIHFIYSTVGNWDFDIAALSNVTYYVYFSGNSMTLTGDISALSNVSYYVRFSGNNMTLTGDISVLSNVSYQVYFSGSLMTLTGDISALSNVTYSVYFSGNSMTLTGDISVLSNVSYQVYFSGSLMTLTGDISALSNVSYHVNFNGNNMSLTGDISALSNVSYRVYFNGSLMTLTGDISALSNVSYYVRFSGNNMTLTGDISVLSNVSYQVYFSGSSIQLTYTSTTWSEIPSNEIRVQLETGYLATSTEVDSLLIDLEATGNSGTGTIDLRYNNAAPTAASATAISDLQSRGWTVLTN